MKKVLVLWADNKSANYGVRVLAHGMAALARTTWGADTLVDFQDYGPGDSSVSFGAKNILRDLRSRRGPIHVKLSTYDIVIDCGAGDSFTDTYGMKRLITMLYAQRSAFQQSIPVVMGPQTIGPFNTWIGRHFARASLKRMSAVIARDSESYQYSKDLGRVPDALATDVVFALPQPLISKSDVVLVNVSGLLWYSDTHVGKAKYQEKVRALIDLLLAKQHKVTLLAHVINVESSVDDRAAIRELASEYEGSIGILFPVSLEDARNAIAAASVVIGARMHACLNGLSTGTPAIPWAYSRKFAPLMADIGWSYGFDLRTDQNIVEQTVALLEPKAYSRMLEQVNPLQMAAQERIRIAIEILSKVK